MTPTIKVSVNSKNSLLQISNFENYQFSEKELDLLSPKEISKIFRKVKDSLHDLKQEKTEFIATTRMIPGSNIYNREMAALNLRRNKIMKNYMMLERRLTDATQEFRERIRNSENEEFQFLLKFWKNAKKLNIDFFNSVTEETLKTNALPESLKGGN